MQHIFQLANCLYLFLFSYWKRPWQHTAIFPCLFDVHVFPRSAWIKWKVNFRWKSFNIHALCAINLSTYTIYLKYIRCIRLYGIRKRQKIETNVRDCVLNIIDIWMKESFHCCLYMFIPLILLFCFLWAPKLFMAMRIKLWHQNSFRCW